jgi:thiol-disulfide isomerase/thioredoxin
MQQTDPVEAKIAEFEERVRQCESQYGPRDPKIADILDEYVAFLKTNHLRSLDAANLAARARIIRGKKQNIGDPLAERLSGEYRKPDRGGSNVILIACVLVAVIGISAWFFNAVSRQNHNADVERMAETGMATGSAAQPRIASSAPSGQSAAQPDAASSTAANGNASGSASSAAGSQDSSPSPGLLNANSADPGNIISVNSLLTPGKQTVLFLHSEHCGPCRQIAPYVEQMARLHNELRVYNVDIDRPGSDGIDWMSPAARQFGLDSVPAFVVYDEHGTQIANGDSAREMVDGWMRQSGTVPN